MPVKEYELIVIGAGPGGYVAAIRAAQILKKPGAVACVEEDRLGGTCLNWGCIPTKALIRSAELFRDIQEAEKFGLMVGKVSVDLSKVVDRSRMIADTFNKNIAGLFKKNRIDSLLGHAEVIGPNVIRITKSDGTKEEYGFKKLVLATGCKPRALPGTAFDGKTVISSKEALLLREVPKRMVIIGAGAIGVEFAYYYSAFGTQVTMVEMLPALLPIEDHEVSAELLKCFKGYGVDVRLSTKTEKVEKLPAGGAKLTISDATGKQSTLEADVVLVAIGVQAYLDNLFTGPLKPELNKGHIKVDKAYKSSLANIYAIGDCIGPPWLAHKASHEAINAIEQMYGVTHEAMDYSTIPGCTYCEPQVASLGLTERKAVESGLKIKVGKIPFKFNGKAWAGGHTEGFVKLIFSEPYGELLGAHIIGHNASDLIAELGLARKLEATFESIRDTIHAHPTLSEVMMDAAQQAGGWVIHG